MGKFDLDRTGFAGAEGERVSAMATASPKQVSHRECAENYAGELFRHGRYRVAVCRDGLQWLFQRQRRRFAPGGAAWDTLGYCRTRAALIRLHRSHVGGTPAALSALPASFKREGGR